MNGFKCLNFLWISFCIVGTILFLFDLLGLRVNLTGSMPIGIYQQQRFGKMHRGDFIALCLPQSIALVGKSRGYIGSGSCPNNSTLLLKKVVAVPGDTVVLSQQSIQVNGIVYYAPQQKFDHNHKLIRHWIKHGIYKPIQSVWVYGSGDPIHSWDSRYFGGIPIRNIQGVYRPLWVVF